MRHRPSFVFAAVLCTLLFAGMTQAATIEKPLADAAQERTARAIFDALKCVVCQGQSLADSDAELAREMRAHVRERVAAGESRAQVLAFFQTRYGKEILMTPPIEGSTYALWLAPLVIVGLGAALVWRHTRHQTGENA